MHSRSATIAHHHRKCDSDTDTLFYGGMFACAVGGAIAASPATIVAGSMAPLSGLMGGIGVGYATRKGAQEQVQNLHYAAPKPGDGKKS
eukprot:CAMPEP_0174841126 /NCGR_PEP_ID=MMETSP1114-20130205/9113_1 /TAXON_ID=312471 /ORGANISM="Neobodo designis, Strain CCAP 1951/1" /LENGTH=88 /DNA_ID=CAMNT_0016075301 /DNA_START=1 /DNA_END=264 /DNA_ORIENTATION=+